MRSPKLSGDRSRDWYRYYAGYSTEFVEDALEQIGVRTGQTVLDPWNGSGTTTSVAHERGHPAIGFDANPALVIIGRARLLGRDVAESLEPLAAEILEHSRTDALCAPVEHEPLEDWLRPSSARRLRQLERAIQRVLVDRDNPVAFGGGDGLRRVSALAAFFYVALFGAVRTGLRPFVGSNPTWVKVPELDRRLTLTSRQIEAGFTNAVARLSERLGSFVPSREVDPGGAVRLGNSLKLPLGDHSVGGVVTSPPYCTRIDYVVATRPELAVLGLNGDAIQQLRREMLGTPMMAGSTPARDGRWGATAVALLDAVEAHRSHASATYYRKYFTQYLDSLWQSLAELRRVLQPQAKAIVVVQDSYYKERRVELARIVGDMAESLGWNAIDQTDFAIGQTKARINPRARIWRQSFSATESVVMLG